MNEVIDLARGKRVPFRVMRGQVIDIAVTVNNSDGSSYDFTGHTAEMLVYNSFNKTDSPEYEIDVTLSLGAIQFYHAAITRKKEDLVYQLWITDSTGYRQVWTNGPFMVLNREVDFIDENDSIVISPNGDDITISIRPITPGEAPTLITKTLTSAQILALNTTPVLIIPAPGSGKYISLIQKDDIYTFGGVPYTRNASAAMILSYDAVTTSGIPLVGALLTQSVDAVTISPNGTSFASIAQSLIVNKAVYLKLNAGSFTLGNGTLKLKILYQTITV